MTKEHTKSRLFVKRLIIFVLVLGVAFSGIPGLNFITGFGTEKVYADDVRVVPFTYYEGLDFGKTEHPITFSASGADIPVSSFTVTITDPDGILKSCGWQNGITVIPKDGSGTYSFKLNPSTPAGEHIAKIKFDHAVFGATTYEIKLTVNHALQPVARKEATCTTNGNIAYWECAPCDKYFSDSQAINEITLVNTVIPKKGHQLTHYAKKEPTCLSSGRLEYWQCETCKKIYSDSQAQNEFEGDLILSHLNHSFGQFKKVSATHHRKVCAHDSSHYIEAPHDWKRTSYTVATCTKAGSDTYKCKDCGAEKTETVASPGHLYSTSTLKATCWKEGKVTKTCQREGCGNVVVQTLPKTAHTIVKDAGKAATCTKSGTKAHWKCSVCYKKFSDSNGKTEVTASSLLISPKGHSWDAGEVTKKATATAAGNMRYTCKTCKETRDVTIPKTQGGQTAPVVPSTGPTNPSKPSTVKTTPTTWIRLYGEKALDTMQTITTEFGKSSVAVVTTDKDFKDALAASAFAGRHNAPILMTNPKKLSPQTSTELRRMKVKTVYIIGPTSQVSAKVESQIKALGINNVSRLKSSTASGRAIDASKAMGKNKSDTVIIATQKGFYDALSVSPYAYASKSPILYVETNLKLSTATMNHIKSEGFKKAIIVGGPSAIPAAVETQLASAGINKKNITRLAGKDCYKTSLIIAQWANGQLKNGTDKSTGKLYQYASIKFQPSVKLGANNLGVATGKNWYDALAAAAFCGKNKAVLLLEDDSNYTNTEFSKKCKNSIITAYVFGGEMAISRKVFNECMKSTI